MFFHSPNYLFFNIPSYPSPAATSTQNDIKSQAAFLFELLGCLCQLRIRSSKKEVRNSCNLPVAVSTSLDMSDLLATGEISS